jgi:hypothetical protein
MTIEKAESINSSASRVYMWREGIINKHPYDAICVIKSVSIAQIQTAIEVMEAINRDALSPSGARSIVCTLAPCKISEVKEFADSDPA